MFCTSVASDSGTVTMPRNKVSSGGGLNWRQWVDWRAWAWNIITIRATPKQVALGAALGSFIAFTPLIGLQMLLAGLFATLAGASKKAAMLAVWISNPLTMAQIFAFTYQLGILLGSPAAASATVNYQGSTLSGQMVEPYASGSGYTLGVIMQTGGDMFWPMLLGGFAVGIVAAFVSYLIIHRSVLAYQTRFSGLSRTTVNSTGPNNFA